MLRNKNKLTFSIIVVLVILVFAAIAITIMLQSPKKNSQLNQSQVKNIRYNKKAIELNNYAMNLWPSEILKTQPDTKVANRAIRILDSAIVIDSSYYLAYANKTGILCTLGLKREAIQTMEACVRKAPELAEAFEFLGMLYDAAGKKKEAKANYEKALVLYENTFNKKHLDEKHLFNSRGNQILMLKTLGRKSEAEKLIFGLPKEFPGKEKEIAGFKKLYAKFDRNEIIENIFRKR